MTLSRRERPQVLLDKAGNLQCLYNSAQPCKATWGDDCHSYTIAQCVPEKETEAAADAATAVACCARCAATLAK